MIRSSITGTTARPVARVRSTISSVASGSNRRRITTVQHMVAEIASWPNPQAWNIGAATTVVSPARHGIRSSIAASEPAAPPERRAPFGVPVVPEVSSTVRPGPRRLRRAAGRGAASISSSRVCTPGWVCSGSSTQASTSVSPGRRSLAWASSGANSSSYTTTVACSRSSTSRSCGPEKPVLSSSASAPMRVAAASDSTRPRWLRHRIPSVPSRSAEQLVQGDARRRPPAGRARPRSASRARRRARSPSGRAPPRARCRSSRWRRGVGSRGPGAGTVRAHRRDHAAADQHPERGQQPLQRAQQPASRLIPAPGSGAGA